MVNVEMINLYWQVGEYIHRILLCKEKNNEIVEFALSRNLSPNIIAEYQTILPDKKVLQQKLHELFENELA